ncbi:flagellar hook-associated protein FlgL [Colwellia sp. 6_MG-2023]|uniref:flagellar hook-associated protein FlgL n=1 Tax=Colwellia sp. 6_MG-2023 TaxID=3062676 RepID=UPI0026E1DE6D|nr:flagellar hook-associated protein FlgL [Colwellia sp. 6_MG-2023]MDO6489380.1 flagellar hook-associated protein FlgL [Colwellia sp. 6_MG-2023]
MRVSTAQFYFQSSQIMSQKTSEVSDQMAHISSGLRVHTAKDDAVSYGTLSGLKDDLANIEKYKSNIIMAESDNNLQDVVFGNAELILNRITETMLLANNGVYDTEALQTLANEVRDSFDQLLDIANTQNENGDYIFAGFQNNLQPFSQNTDGSVVYTGDTGINELQISKNITIETNQTGDAAFLNIENAIGDFTADYITNTSGVAVESAKVADRNVYNGAANPHDYTFAFDAVTNDLTVTDSAGSIVYPPTPYTAGQTITFDGVDVTLSGNPLPGDSFVISEEEEISIFETINGAIEWMERGVISDDDNPEQHQVDYSTLLTQLNAASSHMTSRRVDAGVRLQVLETQENRHLDTELATAVNLGQLQDLDYAKAISEFEQSQIALQASQQTFTTVQGLSLFNYI